MSFPHKNNEKIHLNVAHNNWTTKKTCHSIDCLKQPYTAFYYLPEKCCNVKLKSEEIFVVKKDLYFTFHMAKNFEMENCLLRREGRGEKI